MRKHWPREMSNQLHGTLEVSYGRVSVEDGTIVQVQDHKYVESRFILSYKECCLIKPSKRMLECLLSFKCVCNCSKV